MVGGWGPQGVAARREGPEKEQLYKKNTPKKMGVGVLCVCGASGARLCGCVNGCGCISVCFMFCFFVCLMSGAFSF